MSPLASLELLLSKSGQVRPKSISLGKCNCPAAVNKKTAIETVGFVRSIYIFGGGFEIHFKAAVPYALDKGVTPTR